MNVYNDPFDDPVLHGSPGDRQLARWRRDKVDRYEYKAETGTLPKPSVLLAAPAEPMAARWDDEDLDMPLEDRARLMASWAVTLLRREPIWHDCKTDGPNLPGVYWCKFANLVDARPLFWSIISRSWEGFVSGQALERQPTEWSSDISDLDRSPFGGRWNVYMPGTPRPVVKRPQRTGTIAWLARGLEVSRTTVYKWLDQGCPRGDLEAAKLWRAARPAALPSGRKRQPGGLRDVALAMGISLSHLARLVRLRGCPRTLVEARVWWTAYQATKIRGPRKRPNSLRAIAEGLAVSESALNRWVLHEGCPRDLEAARSWLERRRRQHQRKLVELAKAAGRRRLEKRKS